MTYTNVEKDGNSVSVLCGIDSITGQPIPVQIDPVTGRVLAELHLVSDDTSTLSANHALKDGNSAATMLGVADDASGYLIPVIDHRNGFLFTDLVTE